MSSRRTHRPSKRNLSSNRGRTLQVERLEDRHLLAIGAELVKDINPGDNDSNPVKFAELNGTAYFAATTSAGTELWKSDGTTAGTVLVKDINQTPSSSASSYPGGDQSVSNRAGEIINVNGTLYFSASDGLSGFELWRSDGTGNGTTRVADIRTGGSGSYPGELTNVNGALFFAADDGLTGRELWKSDGITTIQVRDINTLGSSSGSSAYYGYGSYPTELTNVNGTLFFSADDGNTGGPELWKSNGTTFGTVLVKDINSDNTSTVGSRPAFFANVSGTLFFTTTDIATDKELWISDGTAAGTLRVAGIGAGSSSSSSGGLTEMNGLAFFQGSSDGLTRTLWKSNGTAAGTGPVTSMSGDNIPEDITNVGGTLYFNAFSGSQGWELWKSDGSAAGTMQLKNINGGPANADPFGFTEAGGLVYFSADDGTNGRELWSTDGTTTGTQLVQDINPSGSSYPAYLTNIGGTLLFAATEPTNGRELWRVGVIPPRLNVSGNVIFTENQASAVLDPNATVSAPAGTNFTGGQLRVRIATNADANDLLQILNAGNAPGRIGLSGNNVTFGGLSIGTFAGGDGTAPLVVTFNDNATLTSIRELLQAIAFRTRTDNPAPGRHRIEFVLTDGAGDASNTGVVFVTTRAVNDPPKLTLSGTTTYNKNSLPILLAPGAGLTDADSPNFGGGRLQVTITANATASDRLEIRSGTPAPGVINVVGLNVRLNTTTIGTIVGNGAGTAPLIISFNANATQFAVRALTRAITFRTVGNQPSTAQRTITFVVGDGDGGRSTPATATKFVKVSAIPTVSADPVLTLNGSVNYFLNTDAVFIAPDAVLSDPDSPNFAGGQLRVQITTGASSSNRLGIAGGAAVDANLNVRVGNIVIGKLMSNGFGTNDLTVDFNFKATAPLVQQLLRSITFKTEGGSPGTRDISITLTDGGGGTVTV